LYVATKPEEHDLGRGLPEHLTPKQADLLAPFSALAHICHERDEKRPGAQDDPRRFCD